MDNQEPKEKTDPWTIEFIRGAIILLVVEVMIFSLPFLSSRYLKFSFFLASIWFIIFGGYILYIGYKYWNRMVKRSDRLSVILGSLFTMGLGITQIVFDLYPIPPGQLSSETYMYFFPAFYSANSFVAGVIFVIIGVLILRDNYRSSVTRLFFFSFSSFGIAWIMNILYFITRFVLQSYYFFLVFYLFHFLAIVLLAHACRALIIPTIPFQRMVYILLGILFLAIVVLVIAQLKNTIIFTITYSGTFFLLVTYSVLRLTFYPEWLTENRRHWVKRIRIGLLLLAIAPIGEALVDLPIGFLQEHLSLDSPISRIFVILAISISLTYFSGLVIFSGLPDTEIWFFDEVKLRAAPDLKEIDPEVNLTAIWKQIDDWQKESDLTPKEMTTQKLEEYVQAAKNLLIKEGVTAANV
ncbi:MAG: hypothetical protein ACXADY_16855 [Candidatus Hodarchaeales archaeon]|jgi:hypothetical protein